MDPPLELVGFLTRSENRVSALLALSGNPATRPGLQEATGIPRATLSRILADFRDRDLAVRDGHRYRLTPVGEHLASCLRSMTRTIGTMERLQTIERWLPVERFDFELADLADARVTLATVPDPMAPVKAVVPTVEAAGHVRVLCNNVKHAPMLAEWRAVVEGEQRFEAVLTSAVIDVVAADPAIVARFEEIVTAERSATFVTEEDLPGLVAIADGRVLIEVTDEGGALKAIIESENDAVRAWAEREFDARRHAAEPIGIELLTS